MYNVLISLAITVVVAAAVALGGFGWVAAIVPALVAGVAAYILLARRSGKQLERVFEEMQRELSVQPPRFDKAIAVLKTGFAFERWQFLTGAQLHAAIGQILYVKGDFDAAVPHLEKSWVRQWVPRGMLAAARYKKKDVQGAVAALEEAAKVSKKESLLWSVYAWILEDAGRHDEAIQVAGRGAAVLPKDERLASTLQTLQNGKKLKLGKTYGNEWFQFHLERPPMPLGPSMRGNRRALYGRN